MKEWKVVPFCSCSSYWLKPKHQSEDVKMCSQTFVSAKLPKLESWIWIYLIFSLFRGSSWMPKVRTVRGTRDLGVWIRLRYIPHWIITLHRITSARHQGFGRHTHPIYTRFVACFLCTGRLHFLRGWGCFRQPQAKNFATFSVKRSAKHTAETTKHICFTQKSCKFQFCLGITGWVGVDFTWEKLTWAKMASTHHPLGTALFSSKIRFTTFPFPTMLVLCQHITLFHWRRVHTPVSCRIQGWPHLLWPSTP